MGIKSFYLGLFDKVEAFKEATSVRHPEGNLAFNLAIAVSVLLPFKYLAHSSWQDVAIASLFPLTFISLGYWSCCHLRKSIRRLEELEAELHQELTRRNEVFNLNVALVLFYNESQIEESRLRLRINFDKGFPETETAIANGLGILRDGFQCATMRLFTHSEVSLEWVERQIPKERIDEWQSLVEKEGAYPAFKKSRLLFDFLKLGEQEYIQPFLFPLDSKS